LHHPPRSRTRTASVASRDGEDIALREELGTSLRAVRVMCQSIEAGVRARSGTSVSSAESLDGNGDPRVWTGGYKF
jgi:hypothetical protein